MENNIPKDENYTGEGQVNAPKNEDKPHKVEIEINKFQNLVKALNDPRMLAKIIMVTCIIVFLLFLGISLIAMMLKKFYPYNVISTNEYGATFIQNEDKDVIYWLFNSADLWANSGVEVKKGDIVTIHTSGAFHTAIHHLADDAKKDIMTYNWMKPGGGMPSSFSHDDTRAKYRIAPYYNPNTILMQVIPKEYFEGITGEWWRNKGKILNNQDKKLETIFDDKIDGGPTSHIYAIGEGQDNIEIQEDGYLCFAVNDIALTKRKIEEMMEHVEIGDSSGEKLDKGELKMGPYPLIQSKNEFALLCSYTKKIDSLNKGQIKGDSIFNNSNILQKDSFIRRLINKKDPDSIHYINDQFDLLLGIYKRFGDTIKCYNDTIKFYNDAIKCFDYVKKYSGKNDTVIRNIIVKEYNDSIVKNLKDKLENIKKEFGWKPCIEIIERYVSRTMTELDYYYIHNYINAWYDDNVGSFLVVIERKK